MIMYFKLKDISNTVLNTENLDVIISADEKLFDDKQNYLRTKIQIIVIYKGHDIITHLEYQSAGARDKDFKILTKE